MQFSKRKSINIMDLLHFRKIATLGFPISLVVTNIATARFQSPFVAASFIPLQCPLKLLTGIPCPTCGLGRSLICTMTGQFSLAWKLHPLGPIAIISAIVILSLLWVKPSLIEAILSWTHNYYKKNPAVIWAFTIPYLVWGYCFKNAYPG